MLSSSSSGDVFTFDTPEAVLRVLASIRASEATAEQKNELRDLVLSYTNGGKDPSVQIQISQRLQSLGVAMVPTSAKPQVSVPHDFGSTRTVPEFIPGQRQAAPKSPTPTPAPASVQVSDTAPVVKSEAAADKPDVSTQTPPVAPDVAVPEKVVPPVSVASTPEIPTPQPAPTPVATPVEPAVEASATSSVAQPELDGALTRIREIKSLVNEQVGNPVNLVDIDNTVGREYMSALLDAMKQLNSGSGSETAMARLETAYQSVESLLQAKKSTAEQPVAEAVQAVPSAPKPVPAAAQTAATEPTAIPESPSAPVPAAAVPPQPARPDAVADASAQVSEKPQSIPVQTSADSATAGDRWENASAPVVPKPAASTEATIPLAVPAAVTGVEKKPAAATPIRSLADSAVPLKTINDVPTAASVNASETGDPLFTQEVANGLNQLLAEWSLFKKSGLFGTGPNGAAHPLYAKVKDLQVPLLLAGRFEGATQEIKQSVTDYMNGWRYEQGIIYEQGETFDHYLRRVIRHILDLQN